MPFVLVAGASAHAVAFHPQRALYLVWVCTLPLYVFWIYRGERGSLYALEHRRWTAAALAGGLAGLFALAAVMVGIPLAFMISTWYGRSLRRRRRGSPREGGP